MKDKSKIEESRLILRHADEHWSVTTIVGFVCYLQLEDGAMTTAWLCVYFLFCLPFSMFNIRPMCFDVVPLLYWYTWWSKIKVSSSYVIFLNKDRQSLAQTLSYPLQRETTDKPSQFLSQDFCFLPIHFSLYSSLHDYFYLRECICGMWPKYAFLLILTIVISFLPCSNASSLFMDCVINVQVSHSYNSWDNTI